MNITSITVLSTKTIHNNHIEKVLLFYINNYYITSVYCYLNFEGAKIDCH